MKDWSFEPGIVVPLALAAFLFARGAKTLRGVSLLRFATFWAGWLALFFSLASPLHELGQNLFSAHMVQHEILILIAAPALVLSRPLVPMLWAFPISWRKALGHWSKAPKVQQVWRNLTRPLTAFSIHAAALWIWHAPELFQATLHSEWVHAAQHCSFIGSALLFWWSLFHSGRAHYGAGVLYLFTTAVHTSILGALLTFAHAAWYPAYALTRSVSGLTVLEDQQLGGLIMWIPASLVYIGSALALLAMWLRESDVAVIKREAERREYAL